MKKLATVVFAMLLTGSLAFAQTATASPTPTAKTHKSSKKSHKSSKKSNKKGAEPTPSPAAK